jgi:hypothetical protein
MASGDRLGPFFGPPPYDPYLPDGYGEAPELRELFESRPLYSRVRYSCRGALRAVPRELELFCEGSRCDTSRLFTLLPNCSLEEPRYRCACGFEYRFYLTLDRKHLQQEMFVPSGTLPGNDWIYFETGTAAKVGQWPAPSDRISNRLANRLGAEASYYRTAIRLRNFNAGLGAMAYMRRVVEHTVREFLQILAEEAKRYGVEIDAEELDAVIRSHAFDKKFAYAKVLLPAELMPGGHDPPKQASRCDEPCGSRAYRR